MEVAGAVFRQSPCKFSTTTDAIKSHEYFPMMRKPGSVGFKQQKPNRKSVVASVGFSDKSHVEYYSGPPRMAVKEMETKKKEMKKKMKLLKGLSKNLADFSEMGFGLNLDHGSLDQQVKGHMISEATEVLVGQLQKLKAEKMEYKRIKKEEKAKKKAAMMMNTMKDSSSSSSSSSSESDRDNVVNMKQLKTKNKNHQESTASVQVQVLEKVENLVTENAICKDVSNVGEVGVNTLNNKIEVCMGGKCKKSGAEMLLENFRSAIGGEADVVGCKCMGKCRDGPNVRVCTNVDDVANPLCIGVGLEDVESIVTNFFGGSHGSGPSMVPAMSSA
ncbi:diacylglycerol O-acyltransferase 3 [Rutidosis leptorrhynchoides]|uniref:diacylglycerol O-acyltransferase 3 n=1 Tax=Rutidosis leptorrhynchoides TaxID=125765 RepID=UPI003A99DF09